MSQLGDALFTTTQQKVLGLLYAQTERSFYTNEILRLTGMGVATIKRELDRMVAASILTMIKIGNQHHYQANPACPIYSELSGIVRKTFGVADVLREALESIDLQLELAFIFGSIASGTDVAGSDIDLMLVGHDLVYVDLMEMLMPVEESLQRPVNPTVYKPEEFYARLQEGSSFLERVMEQPKLMIKGVIDDFGKSGSD